MTPKRQKKKGLAAFFTSPKLFTVLGVIILVLISIPLSKKWQQKQKVDEEVAKLKQEISQVENKNQRLEELIQYLKSDQFLEEQARKNLGMKKKGEEVVVIEEEKGKVAGAFVENKNNTSSSDNKTKPESNWKKWWNYFFNNRDSSSTVSQKD